VYRSLYKEDLLRLHRQARGKRCLGYCHRPAVIFGKTARLVARRQAIVGRLSAIEELAGMDILCSDKIGTLTQNRLTMGEPYVAEGGAGRRCSAAPRSLPAPKTATRLTWRCWRGRKMS
jgi:hypothetical protein